MTHGHHRADAGSPVALLPPVYSGYLADPFAWRSGDCYYMIGTGPEDRPEVHGRYFPLLRSRDFTDWEFVGHALIRPDPALGDTLWAPEVAEVDGRFYLYYSVGVRDTKHRLRVATADSPAGPYVDAGVALTELSSIPFAIDPSPFRAPDGCWYLFYARDFLDSGGEIRAGTALALDRLTDMTHLAGEERTVLRARHDWQRFDANRAMYGGVYDWHTLEGPFVAQRGDKFVCFYSGGRWDSDRYGVSFAESANVTGPYFETAPEGFAKILHTVQGRLLGPGHNSIVTGPDGETTYIVYHAWNADRSVRSPHIRRLDWSADLPMPVQI